MHGSWCNSEVRWMQAAEYKLNRAAFDMKARQMTEKHAVEAKESAAAERDIIGVNESNLAGTSAVAASAKPATGPCRPDCQVSADCSSLAALTLQQGLVFSKFWRSYVNHV